MRMNLPVVSQEYPFPKGETLVSTTDLKGRILYCNPMFVEVSGYAKEELLGQPHNIVRHPDMPEEAYRDMWHTIASGNAAPPAKVAAEVKAAWIGLAVVTSERPSSSRTCALSASFSVSSRATSAAVAGERPRDS